MQTAALTDELGLRLPWYKLQPKRLWQNRANLFDSQNCTWGTLGNILCSVTCHKPTVLPHPKNQQVCMKSLRAYNYAADFVSTDQFRIEHNACCLGLLPGFSLECAVPDPLFLGPIPSWYCAYREGVVAGDRLKDGDHIEFCAKCLC
jgi:hypothetical protein